MITKKGGPAGPSLNSNCRSEKEKHTKAEIEEMLRKTAGGDRKWQPLND